MTWYKPEYPGTSPANAGVTLWPPTDTVTALAVTTDPGAYETVLEAVKKAGIEVVHSEVGMVPQNYIKLEGAPANQMIRLLEAIEEQDDVQNVFSNFDVDQKQLEEVAG